MFDSVRDTRLGVPVTTCRLDAGCSMGYGLGHLSAPDSSASHQRRVRGGGVAHAEGADSDVDDGADDGVVLRAAVQSHKGCPRGGPAESHPSVNQSDGHTGELVEHLSRRVAAVGEPCAHEARMQRAGARRTKTRELAMTNGEPGARGVRAGSTSGQLSIDADNEPPLETMRLAAAWVRQAVLSPKLGSCRAATVCRQSSPAARRQAAAM
jgi:hypothetical protein